MSAWMFDGVIADFTGAARKLCKEIFNGRPADDLIQTSWAFDSLGITKEEENVMWRTIDGIPNWWMTHRMMPGVGKLADFAKRHRVVFITNRKDGTGYPIERQTAQWLKEWFYIPCPSVVISDNKGPVAAGLNLDYFLDDRPKNVMEVLQGSPRTKVFLYDATYNQELAEGGIARVSTLNDFIDIVDEEHKESLMGAMLNGEVIR